MSGRRTRVCRGCTRGVSGTERAWPQRRVASTETEDTMADDKNPAADNPYTQTHVVQSGDTLSKIAEKYYGDASLYTKIFQANRDLLSDPNKIRPGQKLRIP
jgi:nucleoid-associated protein YgaU